MFQKAFAALVFYFVLTCLFLAALPVKAFGQQSNTVMQSLLHESTFENEGNFTGWAKEICRPGAITLTRTVARKGSYSARFEFAKSDVARYNSLRAELKQNFKSNTPEEGWYGFSIFLPADYVSDPLDEVLAQWHEIPDWELGESWRSPPISLRIENDHYYVKVLWASAAVNTNRSKDGEACYDLGRADKNQWNDWVFHIKFRYDSTGVLEVWKNKVKVLMQEGPNSYNDKKFPYFKIGIYKSKWSGGGAKSPEEKRVLYFDEVRAGNKYSSLIEVSPQ